MTSERRIVLVGPVPPPVHGAARVTVAVSERLLESHPADSIRIVSTAVEGTKSHYHLLRFWRHALVIREIARVRVARLTCVIYIAGAGGLGLVYQALVVLFGRLTRCQIIFHHHSYSYISTKNMFMQVLASLMTARDSHIFLSNSMRDLFVEMYAPSSHANVLSNAHFVPRGRTRLQRPRPTTLVHVSNLSVTKGSGVAGDVFEILRSRSAPDIRMRMVGRCDDGRLRSYLEGLAARSGGQFEMVGRLENEDVFAQLLGASYFLFPSTYIHEAEPLVVLEALSQGVPVIASTSGSLGDLLPVDWLVDDVSAEAFAERIEYLNTKNWLKLSRRAQSAFDELAARGGLDEIMARRG